MADPDRNAGCIIGGDGSITGDSRINMMGVSHVNANVWVSSGPSPGFARDSFGHKAHLLGVGRGDTGTWYRAD
jgi:hypothetical protein